MRTAADLTARRSSAAADFRVLGAVGVVERHQLVDLNRTQRARADRGVWLGPFGRLLYAMPPYICAPDDLTTITGAIHSVVASAG